MATVRLVVLAVCFMVAAHLYSVSARPQFFFPGGIAAQTPIGGFALGVPPVFPFNFGQQQQQQQPQQQPKQEQQPQQQEQPFMGATPQQQPNVQHSTGGNEGLGSRFGGDPEPTAEKPTQEDETNLASPDEYPCQNMDTSTGTNDDGGNVTDQPCAGIGGGNRINPKHAALLSLVG